jgi:serine/threonine-protein kinase HipA
MTIPADWFNAPIHRVEVWTEHLAQPVHVGRLNYERAAGVAYFEWSEAAQQMSLDLSPLMLPLGNGVWNSRMENGLPTEYRGLPGFLNDALPDGWGVYLMDKALARAGIPPEQITPAMRLVFLGDRSWGSLSFRPVIEEDFRGVMTLDALGQEMESTIDGHLDAVSEAFLQAGSSPQGARPKVAVDCDAAFQYARVTTGAPSADFRSWLIKFAGRDEPADAPLMEQVYMDCARQAGLLVMDSRILNLHGKAAFATERFDRSPAGRVFSHTLGGLMHFSHRTIGLDYANVAQVMEALQVPEPAFREAYKRAAFNAAMSVRDDHAKNFAFVKGSDNRWDISHAYDLTYMPGPGGYHTMTFADGNSVDPTQADLLKLASHYHLDEAEARPIIQAMVDTARQVAPMARDLGVSQKTLAPIERRLGEIARSMAPTRSRGRGR